MGIKLLFADDSATMQRVVQLALEHENVALTIAGDGESAFDAAKRERPDVIVADVHMPGVDGFSLCRKVKADAGTAHIPVVLITGEMEEYDDKKGEEAGAASHITKPFKSGELLATIRKLAENAGAAEKPAMLELLKPKASDEQAKEEDDMEVVAIGSETPVGQADDLELNLDNLDLRDLDVGVSPASDERRGRRASDSEVAAPAPVAERPSASERSAPTVGFAELGRIFQELAEEEVREFMARRAPEIFREVASEAIRDQVGGGMEARFEKVFREEIGKIMAEGIGKATPKMLEIMEKATLQITPKIAEQMIKTAIERIKGGKAN
ncbi:MAG: response regulator [Nitrospinae bacterium]|nr:response regulator [Nitrospinota bacterium]